MTEQVNTAQEIRTDGINLTDAASSKVKSLLAQEGRDDLQLRIAVQPGGCSGLRYQLFFDERNLDGDLVTDFNGVAVVVDRMTSLPRRRDDRLRRLHREAGLHHRQPQRRRLLRLWRLLPLTPASGQTPKAAQMRSDLRRFSVRQLVSRGGGAAARRGAPPHR